MAVKRISLEEFLTLAKTHPVLDVRSPGEYLHAHIPGAISLPLFSDEERKVVGTAYKQQSKQVAIKIGLKYFGVKMVEMVETVEALFKGIQKNTVNHRSKGSLKGSKDSNFTQKTNPAQDPLSNPHPNQNPLPDQDTFSKTHPYQNPLPDQDAFSKSQLNQNPFTVQGLFSKSSPNQNTLTDSSAEPSFTPRTVLVHCWRGGMRSAGVAWLLDLYGYQVYTLQGGYKAYRGWVLEQFEKEYPIQILGGYTGSGKTEVLKVMAQQSASVIDLEGLAGHKGSAFGNMGLPAQPSQEHFENKLANALFFASQEPTESQSSDPSNSSTTKEKSKLDTDTPFIPATENTDFSKCIWMEDESQRIGTVNIPTVLYQQMRKKPVYFLEIPFEARLDYICLNYGKFPKEQLVNAVIRIKKRLGGLETKTAINALVEDDVRASFSILLQYYDKQYGKGLERNRENLSSLVTRIEAPLVDDQANAALVQAQQ